MKISKLIYSFTAALMFLLFAGCSPDDYELSKKDFTAEDLVEGIAYSVSVDQTTNTVTLKSLLGDNYQCYWVTPNGNSQGSEVTLQLPFAGTYEVQFGVDTSGGVVYGDAYQFTLTTNNMSLLKDMLYTYLTGGVGGSKKWVPVDKNYGVGNCSGPVMYCNPSDVLNDGSNIDDLAFENWSPNWDPGFQSWLIPSTDPYMDSNMTFSLDDLNGCTLYEHRGESGTKGNSTGSDRYGKWNLNLSDAKHPTLTFVNSYAMHSSSFDEVCSNYTVNVKLIELTPYIMQLATMRTNSEGSWWIVWNFVAEDVQNGTTIIPTEDPGLLTTSVPVLPTIDNVATKLFTTESNGVNYTGDQMTFTIDADAAYDWKWWNGASSTWDNVVKGDYTRTWTPTWTDSDIEDYELVLGKKSDGTYTYTSGDQTGTFTISGNVMTFDKAITILSVKNDYRTVALTGKEWTILSCEAGSQLQIGIPASKDENGYVNSYLVANLDYKAIGGGTTGATSVSLDQSNNASYLWIEGGSLRLPFWSYGSDGKGLFSDVAKVKLKKGQTITVKFTLDGGVTWTATPKCALIDNNIKTTWEPGCFDLSDAATVNLNGETTVSLTNNTDATQTFTSTCLDLSIQLDGYGTVDLGNDDLSGVNIKITSCTIQ